MIHRSARPAAGFTLIELLVVISIIALLIGILLPALGQAREAANAVKCLTQVRSLATAGFTYATDHDEFYVIYKTPWQTGGFIRPQDGHLTSAEPEEGGYWWASQFLHMGYISSPSGYDCPTLEASPAGIRTDYLTLGPSSGQDDWKTDRAWHFVEYGVNLWYLATRMGDDGNGATRAQANSTPRVSEVGNPSETIYYADSRNIALDLQFAAFGNMVSGVSYLFPSFDPPPQQFGYADARHNGSINVAWADGHGSAVSIRDPDNPYQANELTDVQVHLDNKWDLD